MTAPASGTAVHLDEVGVSIQDETILSDLSLEVADGACVAVIGASGSGKSTLLRLINGMQRPTRGRVLRAGRDVADLSTQTLCQQTGYALQQIGLFPHLTVADNIGLPLKLAGVNPTEREHRVTDLAERLGLTAAQLARYPHGLSGGQQQRAGLCRAVILEPAVLLLDEAFSGLDAITRNEALAVFADFQSSRRFATIMVTHDLNEARKIADWLVVLEAGRIVRQGPRDDVLTDPRHPYATALIEAFR
ncbi:MAG: ATP-binding cassette domain-containing protein [Pseudomonadota bacterium]